MMVNYEVICAGRFVWLNYDVIYADGLIWLIFRTWMIIILYEADQLRKQRLLISFNGAIDRDQIHCKLNLSRPVLCSNK